MRLLHTFFIYTILQILPGVAALNILISCTDSWVDKNARYLYPALIEAGHKVVFVGPLHANLVYYTEDKIQTETGLHEISESEENSASGEFGHLKPAHQKHFGNLRKLNTLARRAKNVISSKESAKYDKEMWEKTKSLVQNRAYGQDPLNPVFWYVDGSPVEALAVAFDVILPDHVPEFTPDLVLIGPNEGLHLTCPKSLTSTQVTVADLLTHPDQAEAMRLLAQIRKFRAISVSTEDADHIYYEDEKYFNVEQSSYRNLLKQNIVTKNLEFVNHRVMHLIHKATPHLNPGQALNVNFPSLNNYMSSCLTKKEAGPSFVQVLRHANPKNILGHVYEVPRYGIKNGSVQLVKKEFIKASQDLLVPESLSELELMRFQKLFPLSNLDSRSAEDSMDQKYSDNEDINEMICNAREYRLLELCRIAVSVNDISKGSELNKSVFDLLKYV